MCDGICNKFKFADERRKQSIFRFLDENNLKRKKKKKVKRSK